MANEQKIAHHVRLKDDTQCIFSWKCQVYVSNSLFSWQAKGCSFGKETVKICGAKGSYQASTHYLNNQAEY